MKRSLENTNEKCERKVKIVTTNAIATGENLTHDDVLNWFISTSKKEKNSENEETLQQIKPTPKLEESSISILSPTITRTRDYLKDLDDKLGELNIEYFKTSGLPQQIIDFFLEVNIKKNTCKTIIDHLFYSKKRSDIYIQKTKELIDKVKSEMIKYYQIRKDKNCKVNGYDSLLFFLNVYVKNLNIVESGRGAIKRTPKLEINEAFIARTTNIIICQWKILCLSPHGISNKNALNGLFIHLCLAILNHMKKGGTGQVIDNNGNQKFINIIPSSEYAKKYFPPTSDMKSYGFERTMLTTGSRLISESYASIKTANLTIPTKYINSVTNLKDN